MNDNFVIGKSVIRRWNSNVGMDYSIKYFLYKWWYMYAFEIDNRESRHKFRLLSFKTVTCLKGDLCLHDRRVKSLYACISNRPSLVWQYTFDFEHFRFPVMLTKGPTPIVSRGSKIRGPCNPCTTGLQNVHRRWKILVHFKNIPHIALHPVFCIFIVSTTISNQSMGIWHFKFWVDKYSVKKVQDKGTISYSLIMIFS